MPESKEGRDYYIDEEIEVSLCATADIRVWESELKSKLDIWDLWKRDGGADYDLFETMRSKTGRTRKVNFNGEPFDEHRWHKKHNPNPINSTASCPNCGYIGNAINYLDLIAWRFLKFRCPEHGIWYEKRSTKSL